MKAERRIWASFGCRRCGIPWEISYWYSDVRELTICPSCIQFDTLQGYPYQPWRRIDPFDRWVEEVRSAKTAD